MIWLQKEREAFEEWYENVIGRSLVYKTYDKSYLNSKTQEACEAWQAAKEHESNKSGQITVTHERMQELIAIGVKSSLEAQEQKA